MKLVVSPLNRCMCGHAQYVHDDDIAMCNICVDHWFHRWAPPPSSWQYPVSFTDLLFPHHWILEDWPSPKD